uniref:Immunoglobulin V-set domain-containing protein n=1 Tax=Salarias fasciatus TaxID=181472 RepID=A0A672HXC0_SALFA
MLLVSLLLLHTFTGKSTIHLLLFYSLTAGFTSHHLFTNISMLHRKKTEKIQSYEFFWYRQYPGKPPQCLISHSVKGSVGINPVPGLNFSVTEKQIHLIISSAAVSDSAVYYCAPRGSWELWRT